MSAWQPYHPQDAFVPWIADEGQQSGYEQSMSGPSKSSFDPITALWDDDARRFKALAR
jgi:hypothetical protein